MPPSTHLKPQSVYRLFLRMGGWLVILLGVACLLLSLLSALDADLAERFEGEGRQVAATVSHKRHIHTRNPDGSLSTAYWVTLRYRTSDGEQLMLERLVSAEESERALEGAKVYLLYLPDDPQRVELSANWFQSAAEIKKSLALSVGVLWLLLLWIIGKRSVDAIRAREFGTREPAIVTAIRKSAILLPGYPDTRVFWQDFKGEGGHSLLYHGYQLSRLDPGKQIEIFRSPQGCWWIGDVGDRAGVEKAG